MADLWVPLRAGSDIIFLGAMVNYVLTNNKEFREYVVRYTNAPSILREDFKDTEDLDGLFSGWDPEQKKYDPETWAYRSAPPKKVGGTPGPADHGGGHGRDRGGLAAEVTHFEWSLPPGDPISRFRVCNRH